MLQPRRRAARTVFYFLFFLILPVGSSAILVAQEAQIRSRVELVVVPVAVKGKNGTLTAGLKKEDFTLKEAGKAQTITNITAEPVALSAVIIFDTGLSEMGLNEVKASLPALLGAFADEDEIAVYHFNRSVEKIMDFTTDRASLATALEKLNTVTPSLSQMTSGPFSMPGPVINGVPIIPGVSSAGRTISEPTKVLHDAMFQAAEDLGTRNIERRRVVVVIADGDNHNSRHSFDTAVERLLTREVQVFSVGVDASAFQRVRSALGSYAKDTGGEARFPDTQAELESSYSISTETARNLYILSYISSNKRPVGKPVFREIKVQVAVKNSTIRHKRGYYQGP
jgi:VWFA-related protein